MEQEIKIKLISEFTRLGNCFRLPTNPDLKYPRTYFNNLNKVNRETKLYWKMLNKLSSEDIGNNIRHLLCTIVLPSHRWVIQMIKFVCNLYDVKAIKVPQTYNYSMDTYDTLILVGYEYDPRLADKLLRYILTTIFLLQRKFRAKHNKKTLKNRRHRRIGKKVKKLVHTATASSDFKNKLVRESKLILKQLLANKKKTNSKARKMRLLKIKFIKQYIKEHKLNLSWKIMLN